MIVCCDCSNLYRIFKISLAHFILTAELISCSVCCISDIAMEMETTNFCGNNWKWDGSSVEMGRSGSETERGWVRMEINSVGRMEMGVISLFVHVAAAIFF